MVLPYRVLDLTDETGFMCGKILADLGADVIKVEAPGGDAARMIGPFPDGQPNKRKSLYWSSYNTDKRGITLNLHHSTGIHLFKRLVEKTDFLIETFPPGRLTELGLGFESLKQLNPRLIMTSITPFGQSGPYKHFKGKDLVAMAQSGMMSLMGEQGKPPLRVSLPQSPMWTGMYAASGSMIALYHRTQSGEGQHVDISLQTGLLWALANAPAFWSTNRLVPRRDGVKITGRSVTGATMQAIFPCKDGYINFIIYGGDAGRRSNQALVSWLHEEGLASENLLQKDWSIFKITTSTQEEIHEIEEPAAELFRRYTKAEFLDQGFKRGMLGYPVATAQDILDDPQLQARDFWRDVDIPFLNRKLKFPGGFVRFSDADIGPHCAAPDIGEHNAEIYQGELGLRDDQYAELQHQGVI